ncbi:unnamed protein product [Caenorhabditis nigoni]
MTKLSFEREAPIEVPVFDSVLDVEDVQEGTEFPIEGKERLMEDLTSNYHAGPTRECVPLHICARPSEQAFVFNSNFKKW